jgi:hypothetical protein
MSTGWISSLNELMSDYVSEFVGTTAGYLDWKYLTWPVYNNHLITKIPDLTESLLLCSQKPIIGPDPGSIHFTSNVLNLLGINHQSSHLCQDLLKSNFISEFPVLATCPGHLIIPRSVVLTKHVAVQVIRSLFLYTFAVPPLLNMLLLPDTLRLWIA